MFNIKNVLNNRYIIPAKLGIMLVIFVFAVNYENAQYLRLIILFAAFVGIIILSSLRFFISDKRVLICTSFLTEILLIMLLEYNSRFVINYFFHVFYLLIIFEICIRLNNKPALYIGAAAIIASAVKYIYLISFKFNYSNVSQMIFSLMIYIFVLTVLMFLKQYFYEKERINDLYKELLATHKQLQYYTKKAENLAVMNERTKVARDLHDTLGHMLTGIIMRLEMAVHVYDKDNAAARAYIVQSCNTAREGLATVREIVDTLRSDNDKNPGVMSIETMVNKYAKTTGVDINLKINDSINTINPTIGSVLYSIVREAITNSVRHGEGTYIEVIIQKQTEYINLEVKDNGKGCQTINEGHGLTGIRERIESVNGEIDFNGYNGFTVKGRIPL